MARDNKGSADQKGATVRSVIIDPKSWCIGIRFLSESAADDQIERFSESLRSLEDPQLTGQLSKLYHDLKSLDHGKENFDEKKDFELAMIKRKIGSLEEEIGRRKKDGVWIW